MKDIKITRRSALALIASGLGIAAYETDAFSSLSANRNVNLGSASDVNANLSINDGDGTQLDDEYAGDVTIKMINRTESTINADDLSVTGSVPSDGGNTGYVSVTSFSSDLDGEGDDNITASDTETITNSGSVADGSEESFTLTTNYDAGSVVDVDLNFTATTAGNTTIDFDRTVSLYAPSDGWDVRITGAETTIDVSVNILEDELEWNIDSGLSLLRDESQFNMDSGLSLLRDESEFNMDSNLVHNRDATTFNMDANLVFNRGATTFA